MKLPASRSLWQGTGSCSGPLSAASIRPRMLAGLVVGGRDRGPALAPGLRVGLDDPERVEAGRQRLAELVDRAQRPCDAGQGRRLDAGRRPPSPGPRRTRSRSPAGRRAPRPPAGQRRSSPRARWRSARRRGRCRAARCPCPEPGPRSRDPPKRTRKFRFVIPPSSGSGSPSGSPSTGANCSDDSAEFGHPGG